jgi:hypothetical protein
MRRSGIRCRNLWTGTAATNRNYGKGFFRKFMSKLPGLEAMAIFAKIVELRGISAAAAEMACRRRRFRKP